MTGASLSAANTLGVPSTAEQALTITDEDQLRSLVATLKGRPEHDRPTLTVLGGGSNVVLRRHVSGIVCLMRTRGIRQRADPHGTLLTVAAGERWHDLVRYALGQGLAGLENLALIPGAVGAAPIQNIGAYGVELSDRFVSLRALDTCTGRVREFQHADCGFAYRDSVFKGPEGAGLIILDVTLRLHRHLPVLADYPDLEQELEWMGRSRPTPAQVAEAVIRVRRRKLPDPRFVGNVGSFFQNPWVSPAQAARAGHRFPQLSRRNTGDGRVKLSAAQLIDACGWKGRLAGRVRVWHRQPLVLINAGGATGAGGGAAGGGSGRGAGPPPRRDVAAQCGITLELEPRVIGQD